MGEDTELRRSIKMVTRSSTKFHDKSLGRYRKLIQTKAKPLGHIENNCKLYAVTKSDSCYSPLPPPPPGVRFPAQTTKNRKYDWACLISYPDLTLFYTERPVGDLGTRLGRAIFSPVITTVYMQRVLTI